MKINWSLPNIQKPEMKKITKVVQSGWLSMGKEVKKLSVFLINVGTSFNKSRSKIPNSGSWWVSIIQHAK